MTRHLKRIGLMLVGAAILFAVEIWYFTIPKEQAEARRYWNRVYNGIAVCPIDEMAGVD